MSTGSASGTNSGASRPSDTSSSSSSSSKVAPPPSEVAWPKSEASESVAPGLQPLFSDASKIPRAVARKLQIIGTVFLLILIILVASLLLGSAAAVHVNKAHVLVVDLDGSVFTQHVAALVAQACGTRPNSVTYVTAADPLVTQAADKLNAITHLVGDATYFGAVVLAAGAGARLNASLTSRAPYTTPAVSLIFDEGRNSLTINTVIAPQMRACIQTINAKLAAQQLSSIDVHNADPTAVVSPLQSVDVNLHPVGATGLMSGLACTTVYLLMWIMASASIANTLNATKPLEGKVRAQSLTLYKITYGLANVCLMTLVLSVFVVIFGGEFQTNATFGAYWMYNWLGMSAMAAVIAFANVTLGPKGNILLVLFMALNISSGALGHDLELLPAFYRIGYGLPFWNLIAGARTIFYGSRSFWQLHLPVLFAFFIVFMTGTCLAMRRQYQRGAAAEQRPVVVDENSDLATVADNVITGVSGGGQAMTIVQ